MVATINLTLFFAYFPHHGQVLRLAFEGTAYEYMVLLFSLSLTPHTFTKYVWGGWGLGGGVCILVYLDDWALIASSKEQAAGQLSLFLSHTQAVGFLVNLQKSLSVGNMFPAEHI